MALEAEGLGGEEAAAALVQYGLSGCEASSDAASWVNRIDIVPTQDPRPLPRDAPGPALALVEQVGGGGGGLPCGGGWG